MKTFKNYELGKVIGSGGEGSVHLAVDLHTAQQVVVKVLATLANLGQENQVLVEYQILSTVSSPYILPLYDCFKSDTHCYMVHPYYPTNLATFLKSTPSIPELVLRKWAHQLLRALVDLHFLDIVHRDLKPSNILLSEDSLEADLVICNFGVSKIDHSGTYTGFACSLLYAAPELFVAETYDSKVDVFSIGVVLYEIVSQEKLQKRIVSQDELSFGSDVSELAAEFIRLCLTCEPRNRPTAFELIGHRFLNPLNRVVVNPLHKAWAALGLHDKLTIVNWIYYFLLQYEIQELLPNVFHTVKECIRQEENCKASCEVILAMEQILKDTGEQAISTIREHIIVTNLAHAMVEHLKLQGEVTLAFQIIVGTAKSLSSRHEVLRHIINSLKIS